MACLLVEAQNAPAIHWINDSSRSGATPLNNTGTSTTSFQGTNDVTATQLTGIVGGLVNNAFGGATPGNTPGYPTSFLGSPTTGTGTGTAGTSGLPGGDGTDATWATWGPSNGTLAAPAGSPQINRPLDVLTPDQSVDRLVIPKLAGSDGGWALEVVNGVPEPSSTCAAAGMSGLCWVFRLRKNARISRS